jgi:redox-sensing transcriptional repressor
MGGTIPRATVNRLPRYLQYLERVSKSHTTVSSQDIAAGTGSSAAQVRKDLSHLDTTGTRGVGYDVETLRDLISRSLGLSSVRTVALVGAGNLGNALANYGGFEERGFQITAIYDANPSRIGWKVDDLEIRSIEDLVEDAKEEPFEIGIVATPPDAAQEVADLLVEAGVGAILNFAPVTLNVPIHITVRRVDLATELRILSYHLARANF